MDRPSRNRPEPTQLKIMYRMVAAMAAPVWRAMTSAQQAMALISKNT